MWTDLKNTNLIGSILYKNISAIDSSTVRKNNSELEFVTNETTNVALIFTTTKVRHKSSCADHFFIILNNFILALSLEYNKFSFY